MHGIAKQIVNIPTAWCKVDEHQLYEDDVSMNSYSILKYVLKCTFIHLSNIYHIKGSLWRLQFHFKQNNDFLNAFIAKIKTIIIIYDDDDAPTWDPLVDVWMNEMKPEWKNDEWINAK